MIEFCDCDRFGSRHVKGLINDAQVRCRWAVGEPPPPHHGFIRPGCIHCSCGFITSERGVLPAHAEFDVHLRQMGARRDGGPEP
jgi:hypothetical protein